MTAPQRSVAHSTPEACSALSALLDEPIAGTAAVTEHWLCLEQPGPWGRDALAQSHLDTAVAEELSRRAEAAGIRVVLIRRPGSHADTHLPRPRQVYFASTRPGATRLEATTVLDPKELLDLDLAALARAGLGLGPASDETLLLVCTNGRRDVCCALLGRPIAGALAKRRPDAVWECTHIGGHRFAPTALVLPTGYSYGRLDVPAAAQVLAEVAAGRVTLAGNRGRSTWSRPGQAAELAVRELIGELDADALTVSPELVVRHLDGRRWLVTVEERLAAPPRPESCGKAPGTPTAYVVTAID